VVGDVNIAHDVCFHDTGIKAPPPVVATSPSLT